MKRLFAPVLAVSAALAACTLPTRDNGFDPLNAPVADLQFFDASLTGCSGATVGTAIQSILSIDRGRCLGLSALGSTDPQDVRPGLFRFSVFDDGGEIDLSGGFTPEPVLVLGTVAVRELPPNEPIRFRLLVQDSSGTITQAEREIEIRNAGPVVPHVSSMTVPFGGYPWSTSGTIDIRFESGEASDPNGDVIDRYIWTFPDGVEISSDPTSPAFTRTIDVNEYRPYVARFRVEDDAGQSAPEQRIVVNRRTPNIWMTSHAGFSRVDAIRTTLPITTTGSIVSRYFEPRDLAPKTVLVYERFGPPPTDRAVSVLTWPSLTSSAPVAIPTPAGPWGIAMAPDGTQVAVVDASGSTGTVRRIPYNGSSLGSPVTTTVSMPSEGVGLNPLVEITDDAIWVSRRHENIYAIDRASGTLLDTFTDTLPSKGLAPRPGTNELWTARSAHSTDPAIEYARLHRFTGVAPPQVFETGKPRVRWITWSDDNDLWVVLDDETVLVDVSALEAGATFEAAIVVRAPTSLDALYAFTDLSVGDVIVQALGGAIPTRVRTDGTTRPATAPGFMEYADGQGGVWTTTDAPNPGLVRSHPDGGVSPETQFFSAGGGGPDGQGGLWVAGGSLFAPFSSILRIGEDGSILRRHETWIVDGTETGIPAIAMLRTQPGTNKAWAHAIVPFDRSLGIFHVDLGATPPVATLILDSSQSAQFNFAMMEPSSPMASTSFTWVMGNSLFPTILTTSGQITPSNSSLNVSGGQDETVARSLVSNGLCIGSINYTASATDDFFRAWWVPAPSPGNPPVPFLMQGFTVQQSSGFGPTAVSRTTAGTGDVCWMSWNDPRPNANDPCSFANANIRVYNAGGSSPIMFFTNPIPGRITGLRPIDTNKFWMVIERCTPTGTPIQEVELWTRAPTGALVRTAITAPNVNNSFVDWESNSDRSMIFIP